MKEVCIACDVTTEFIIDDYSRYQKYICGDTTLPYIRLFGSELKKLNSELQIDIQNLLSKRINSNIVNTKVSFKDRLYELNFKDPYDFNLCAFIALFGLLENAIKFNSSIITFDRERLKQYHADIIITEMRYSSGKSYEELCTSLQRKSNSHLPFIEKNLIQISLSYLIDCALISFDRSLKEYKITATGYLFR